MKEKLKVLRSLENRKLKYGSVGALDFLITREKARLAKLGVKFPIEPRISKTEKGLCAKVEASPAPPFDEQIKLAKSTGHFHKNWYLTTYQGMGDLGKNPITHYLREGAELGLNPGKNFDTKFYLETYPDAAASGLNPLVHFALYGKKAGYATKRSDPRKQINAIRTKLLSLGFTERPLAELTEIATIGDDPVARAMAARELALWRMRAKTEHDYRIALTWIARSRLNAPDLDFRAKLATIELLCHYHLNNHDEGLAAFERATHADEAVPDLLLARVNFEKTLEGRVEWINKVLAHYNIEPITLLPDEGQPPYDRLTCAVSLPKVTDGPKVTVLIAAYDAAEVLPTALRSLQEQTWANLEIIVLDDCSPTLDTVRVAEGFAANDPRIQVVRMAENGGAYVARNHGLDMATGEFVTLHDADDWSHPRKIETQVRFMLENPEVMGCTSEQARAGDMLEFLRVTLGFNLTTSNTSSFLWRRKNTITRFGRWENIRFGADTALIKKIEHIDKNLVFRIKSGPLSFQRNTENSAVNDTTTAAESCEFGIRKELKEISELNRKLSEVSAESVNLKYPLRLRPNRLGYAENRDFKVVIASDFRMQGGSTQSSIQEMNCHRKYGVKTGVFQMYRYDFSPARQMELAVREQIDEETIQLLTYGDQVHCDLLIIRYPPVLYHYQRYMPEIKPKQIKVIVNQPPMSDYGPEGVIRYELEKCAENIRRYFGKDATWHPIGPLVRETLHTHHADQLHHIKLSDQDWHNIIDIKGWDRGPRQRGPKDKLRIGRHSRDHAHKWPDRAEDILAAYPDREDVEVHILGGGKTPDKILGRIPQNWTVHEFGSIHPRDFLRVIDVWIYFANPGWVESFGRTIIEAMAVGVPVILPETYRPLFEDSVLYATPQTALELAQKLHSDPVAYDRHVAKAKTYVRDNFSYEMHLERLQLPGGIV